MFQIGFWELFLIVVVGLLVVGPKQLPQVAKTVTKAVRKLRRTGDDLRDSARQVVEEVIPPEDLYGYDDDDRVSYTRPESHLPPTSPPAELTEAPEEEQTPKDGDGSLAS